VTHAIPQGKPMVENQGGVAPQNVGKEGSSHSGGFGDIS